MSTNQRFIFVVLFLFLITKISSQVSASSGSQSSDAENTNTKSGLNIKYDKDVAILTAINFKKWISKYDYSLVEFYSPNCKHCIEFGDEVYNLIGAEYKESEKLGIGKISCYKYPRFTAPFKITHYPTLLFFYKGKVVHAYTGNRSKESMDQYLSNMQRFIEKGITTKEDAEFIKTNFTKAVVYYGDPNMKKEDREKAVADYKKLNIKQMATFCFEKDIIESQKAMPNSIVIYKIFDEGRNDLRLSTQSKGGDISVDMNEHQINEFLNEFTKAYYTPYDQEAFLKIFIIDTPVIALFDNCTEVGEEKCDQHKKFISQVARMMAREEIDKLLIDEDAADLRKDMIYTFVDANKGNYEKYLAKKGERPNQPTKYPSVKIFIGKDAFDYQGKIGVKEIVYDFIIKFLNNQLIPIPKEQPKTKSKKSDL